MSTADPSAVHALAILVNDADNHSSLLAAGAVDALADALRLFSGSSDPAVQPLRVNLIRVLADLAKTHDAFPYFDRAAVPELLAELIKSFPPAFSRGGGFFSWMLGWMGLGEKPEPRKEERGEGDVSSLPRGDMTDIVDYLGKGLQVDDMPIPDLDAGISYHAVRCVSNLARNSAAHHDLLKAGLLPLLLSTLRNARIEHIGEGADQQLAEVVRCTVLAVAALGKSAPDDVTTCGGHTRLIYFTNQMEDEVTQMYAAGGIRNLTRHPTGSTEWHVHRELVVGGVADALLTGMRKDANAQTQVFSALAFGDLMTTGHHKADLVRKRLAKVYPVFAKLIEEKNVGVARAVYKGLTAMYGDGSPRPDLVAPADLSKLLGEHSGQLVNGPVARGDIFALRTVRAMCRDATLAQEMVSRGLLEVLVRGVNKGKGEYWEQSIAALAEVSNFEQLRSSIVSSGALRAVLQRPFLDHDARYAAKFFANMARSEDHHVEVAHAGTKVFLSALLSKDEKARNEGARGLYNLSLGGVSKIMIGQAGTLIPLVKAASSSGDTRRFAIAALARVSEAFEHGTKLVEADFLSIALEAVKEDPKLTKDVARSICNLSQNVEVHGLLARSGAAVWLVEMMSKNGGRGEDAQDVLHFASLGICNLSYSAGITRTVLRESGAVPLLTALSTSGMTSPLVTHSARQALSNLRGSDKPAMVPVEALPKPSLPA